MKDGERLPPGSIYRDFTAARRGEVPRETVRSVYCENTEYVLEFVEDLIANIDGRSVITSDHGTFLGEGIPLVFQLLHPRWSIRKRERFKYAHFTHLRLPTLIEVPWVERDGGARREIEASDRPEGVEMDRESIEEQLRALGYRD